MAGVTGPISTLPGTRHKLLKQVDCDDHPGVPAIERIQGETDSFGSEMHDLCKECVDKMNKEAKKERFAHCDWCKELSNTIRPMRDADEGMAGPVYQVCQPCRNKYHISWIERK